MKLIRLLEHVLEFSSTWNGVLTEHFFPESPKLRAYLASNGMLRIGGFFSKPFVEVSRELRQMEAEYPFLLQKLYEAYYLRPVRRKTVHGPVSV